MQRLIDELKSRFGVDPADGLQIISTASALRVPFDPGMALLLLPAPAPADAPAAGLPGRTVHALNAATMLRGLYPADHAVAGLDGAPDASVGTISVAELQGGAHFLAGLVG